MHNHIYVMRVCVCACVRACVCVCENTWLGWLISELFLDIHCKSTPFDLRQSWLSCRALFGHTCCLTVHYPLLTFLQLLRGEFRFILIPCCLLESFIPLRSLCTRREHFLLRLEKCLL